MKIQFITPAVCKKTLKVGSKTCLADLFCIHYKEKVLCSAIYCIEKKKCSKLSKCTIFWFNLKTCLFVVLGEGQLLPVLPDAHHDY